MNQITIRETSNLNGKEWFRVKDLSQILSMGESTIWKMVRNNNFPKPQKITERLTVWTRKDILDWVRFKIKDSDCNDINGVREALVNSIDGADHE